MQNIKGWITCLRPFSPRTISLSDSHTLIRNIATIAENTAFQKDTLYIGTLMNAAYRFRTAEEISFVLIDDPKYHLDRLLCGNNTVIILEEGTDRDKVYEACKEYIRIQESILEKRQHLLDAYLSEPSLQSLLDHTAGIIGFPLMILDNSYRVIGSSSSQECDDPLWNDSIKDGFCSYEFVARFHQLSEIDVINRGDGPVLAGCAMSPMRRAIIRMFADKRPIGYLLSVESNGPFDRMTVELLDLAARILSRSVTFMALESGVDLIHATWDAVVNAIEGAPKSEQILTEYLLSAGIRRHSNYYMVLINLFKSERSKEKGSSLKDLFQKLFSFTSFSYYKEDAVMIIEFPGEEKALMRLLRDNRQQFEDYGCKVCISDMFNDFSDIRRYYSQAKQTQKLMAFLSEDTLIASYEEVRIYDVLQSSPEENALPLFMRKKEIELYEYDRDNGTEFFRTLYSYIKNSRRLQDVSDELHIHKNTVSYRINRIKELLDVDLNDSATRMGFYLTYHALRMQGLLVDSD